jgi:NAD(P)-dependent dehydrogenase (short-subunit alcohol dehydrogenase family)
MCPRSRVGLQAPPPGMVPGGGRRLAASGGQGNHGDRGATNASFGGRMRGSAAVVTSQPVAVVTGANRGIGVEVCRQLAERGFSVVLGSRDLAKGERAAERLPDSVSARQLDVADQGSVDAAVAWVAARYGRCDALVNNAGVDYDTDAMAVSADLARVHRAMETNLFGAWRTCLALLPLLRESPHGRIVNVSSEEASLADMGAGSPAYHVTKAALNALTRTLAAELRDSAVLVNAVSPDWTATDMGGSGGRPIAEGAASIVWGVMLPDDGPTGGFFQDGQQLAW